MNHFDAGGEALQDNSRTGAPKTASTESNAALLKQILDEDRHATFNELEEKSGLSRGSLQHIVHQDLELRKVCAR